MNYLLLQTVQPHVKLTHSLVQTQRYYLGYLSHLRSGENFLLSSWTSWHTSTTTGSFRRRGWYRGIRCSCPSRQTLSALRRVHPETLRSLCRLLLPQIHKRESNFPCSLAQITPDNKQRFNTHSVFSRSGLSQRMSLGVQFKYCLKVTKTKEGFLSKLQNWIPVLTKFRKAIH